MVTRDASQAFTDDDAVTLIVGLWETLIGEAVLFNEQVARMLGISTVDLQAFGVIARHGGPITPTEVSARTGLPASTTTRVLDRLEVAGYVFRRNVPGDRRKVAVEVVTGKADEIAHHYLGKIAHIRELNSRRSAAEVAVVVSYLRELVDANTDAPADLNGGRRRADGRG